MGYRTCPYCGASLDAEERCDCRETGEPPVQVEGSGGTRKSEQHTHTITGGKNDE